MCIPPFTQCPPRPYKGEVVYVMGRVWHRRHMKCQRCRVKQQDDNLWRPFIVSTLIRFKYWQSRECPLTETNLRSLSLNTAKLVCIDCYMDYTRPLCNKCAYPLKESFVSALSRKWHHDCFHCFRCNGPMPSESHLYLNI
uniref:LIM zinc-binding domain-containing protein n=1 Tax=Heterorhabditis bacteriophora TaxID=37862 RepID=A0A1I7WAU6_HETBA